MVQQRIKATEKRGYAIMNNGNISQEKTNFYIEYEIFYNKLVD